MAKGMLLLTVTVLVLCLSAQSSLADPGEEDERFWIGGEFTTKGFSLENYKGSGVTDQYVLSRAMISAGAKATDRVSVGLLVAKTRLWGKSATLFQQEEPGASEFLTGGDGFLDNFGVYNAYVEVNDAGSRPVWDS